MGGLTIENNFFILKIEKRNKIIVFDFPKVGAGRQKVVGPRPYQPLPLRGPCINNMTIIAMLSQKSVQAYQTWTMHYSVNIAQSNL